MENTTNSVSGIDRAIELAGSQVRLASRLGVSQQCVNFWKTRGFVPVRRAYEIEAEYGIHRKYLVSPKLQGLFENIPTSVAA